MKKIYLLVLLILLSSLIVYYVFSQPVTIQVSQDGNIDFFKYFQCNVKDNQVTIKSKKFNLQSFSCPLSEKLKKAYPQLSGKEPLFKTTETVKQNYSPKDKRIVFSHIFSVQMKIGEVEYISDEIQGRYVDLGKVTLRLVDVGPDWVLLSSNIQPKYSKQQVRSYNIDETYFKTSRGNVSLFEVITDLIDRSEIRDTMMGDCEVENIKIYVSNSRICEVYVSDTTHATPRGLKVGDDKNKVLKLYDQPDVGYFESDLWGYYFFRDWMGDGSSTLISDDYFHIDFKDGKVSELSLRAYIPID